MNCMAASSVSGRAVSMLCIYYTFALIRIHNHSWLLVITNTKFYWFTLRKYCLFVPDELHVFFYIDQYHSVGVGEKYLCNWRVDTRAIRHEILQCHAYSAQLCMASHSCVFHIWLLR